CADWIVDLGPEAGDGGGEVVAAGTPGQIARVEKSHTGKFLAQVLGNVCSSRAVFGASPKSIPGHGKYLDGEEEFGLRAAEEPFAEAANEPSEPRALPDSQKNGAIHV